MIFVAIGFSSQYSSPTELARPTNMTQLALSGASIRRKRHESVMSLVMGSGLAGHLREERPSTTMRNVVQVRAERKTVFGLLNRTTENGLAISATCPVV